MGLKSFDDSRPTTWLDDLLNEEKNAIKELKKRTLPELSNKMLDDPSLFYRFLKARDFNMKNAEAMLRKVLELYAPISVLGQDKEGSPVIFAGVGKVDEKGILKSTKMIDIFKLNLFRTETALDMLKHENEKNGKLDTKVVYVYDFDQLTFPMATNRTVVEMLITWISMYQDNYPERIKAVYVINAQFYFTLLFSALKFIVASAVLKKVHIYGTEGWREVLQEIISSDVLPAFLGGKRTDPDGNPLCKSFLVHGQTVPERYYLSNLWRSIQREPGVKTLNVTRNKSCCVEFQVDESGSYLEWEFETKNKDIGFAVYFKDERRNDAELEEIVPKRRISTSFETETGVWKCERSGSYYLVFDNSYSWMFSKEIYYKVAVLPPKETESEGD
ncbi:SEC14-like protein 2 isoform X3 [Parasteatoda tepidariorum]|uniref:SEC14-like protein 2 isoform X3 n=1 Tax=Parasteatoda tepidariorum TaxID=114398 RepID=UPI0039BC6D6D